MINSYIKAALVCGLFAICFFATPYITHAASRYWVGGGSSSAWNATGPTNWGSTSNTQDNASVPTASDDVFFDGVGTGASNATLSANISVRSLDMTGYSNTLTHNAAVTLTIAGGASTLTLSPTMTYTLGNGATSAITFTGTSGTTLITTGGKTIGTLTFNGSGGTFQLQDTLTSSGSFTRTNGTFDANDQAVVLSGAGAVTITGATTFYNLTRSGSASKTDTLLLAADQVVTNLFTVAGNSVINRVLVASNLVGTPRTITATSIAASHADFRDITGAGAGNWDLAASTGGSGDALGNLGITFTPSLTQYWVGGAGSWADVAEWANVSGGGAGSGRVPLPQDDIVFDNGSFNGVAQAVLLNMPRAGRNITWSAYTEGQAPVWNTNQLTTSIFGSVTLVNGMVNLGGLVVILECRSACTLTTAGVSLGSTIRVDSFGGSVTLQDDFTSVTTLQLNRGTLDANGYNVTISAMSAALDGLSRTLSMGSGTWTLTTTGAGTIWNTNSINFTLNAGSSTVAITGSGANARTFIGSAKTYHNLTVAADNLTITGSNTFNTLAVNTAGMTNGLKLTSGTTQTIANLTTNGSAGNLAKLVSTATSSAATLSKASGTISVDYLSLQNNTASGGALWYAGVNSIDVSGNSGWIFDVPGSLPTVSVQAASSVTNFSATINGSIDSVGGATSTVRGFELGTSTAYGFTTSTSGDYGAGAFSADLDNLLCNTSYHFRAFATNSVGTGYSSDATFTTGACPTTFYVSPTGLGTNNGSITHPWNLAQALSGASSTIQPGNMVYLRGGTYRFATSTGETNYSSYVSGSAGNPVTVQSYPGEWAVIDGNLSGVATKNITMLKNYGDYVIFRDFEMTNSEEETRKIDDASSNPPNRRANSIDDYGTGTKFVNLVIHDTGQGIGAWMTGHDNEYYGNIIYNNGWDAPDRTHGHAFYTQNDTGYKRFSNNIAFNAFGSALRTGGTSDSAVHHYLWENNTLYGGLLGMATQGPDIDDFAFYKFKTYNLDAKVGYEPQTGYQNAVVRKNYFAGGSVSLFDFMEGLTFRNNTVINTGLDTDNCSKTLTLSVVESWTPARFDIDENTYYRGCNIFPYWSFKIQHYNVTSSTPVNYGGDYAFGMDGTQASTFGYTGKEWKTTTGYDANSVFNDAAQPTSSTVVFEHKNRYDDNRADYTIYNWALENTVDIDPSSVLDIGDSYELRNSQDYFGDVITGTYNGGVLSVPMTGRTLARPVGFSMYDGTWYHYDPPTSTFPEFGTFILRNLTGTTDSAAPSISNHDQEVETSSALVLWDTSEDALGSLEYGLTTGYGTTLSSSSTGFTTTHELNLTSLLPGTTYHYRTTTIDANGNSATSPDQTFTTLGSDENPPIISSISSSTTQTSATISWTTDEAATSQVDFGTTIAYGSSSSSEALSTDHSLILSDLTPATTYHFQITVQDASTNTATSTDLIFATASGVDTTAPVISSVASSTGATVVTITWATDEVATSEVEYGTSDSYGSSTSSASLVTSHSVEISGLATSTTYHFRITSEDAAGNVATSSDYLLLTASVVDVTPPSVSLTNPSDGETVTGLVQLSALATDAEGVVGVQFKLDGVELAVEDTSAPYEFAWDTTVSTNGTHTLLAVARDGSGNYATSTSVTVTVSNTQTSGGGSSGGGGGGSSVAVRIIDFDVETTTSTLTLTWRTQRESRYRLSWYQEGQDEESVRSTVYEKSHRQMIEDLQPDTRYEYSLLATSRSGQRDEVERSFRTLPVSLDVSPPSGASSSVPGALATGSADSTSELLRQLLLRLVALLQQLQALQQARGL